MRASIRAALLVAAAALVALQVAQPVSGHLVDHEAFENVTPTLYDYSRRQNDEGTAVPTSTSTVVPTATAAPGARCRRAEDCASGACSQGRCVPKTGTGANNSFCTGDAQCVGGSYCYRGSCQFIKSNDSPCYKDSGCLSGNCINKRCIANASQRNGAQCTKSTQCVIGSFCSNGKCATISTVGKYCYKDQGCTSGHCVQNRCSSRGLAKLGQHCTSNSMCISNFCFKSACHAKRSRNQPCSLNDTCLSGRCRRNKTCA
ncbi:uncharacterized protein UBRO_03101 [Ustilago bromivora]|uniref:Uncharacterized protein n=1 Tax=Ustilago bromivora TaxID=307758 RepID=A0A1K0G2X8_9BASI|nr:uncharacterized protein UBRO_03101 [Ustilago bromivora]SYW74972.1 uncharacterized protein UBRO2_00382 [Ustilago bromivora]